MKTVSDGDTAGQDIIRGEQISNAETVVVGSQITVHQQKVFSEMRQNPEERVLERLNSHDIMLVRLEVTLAKLEDTTEANKNTAMDFIRALREDVTEIKKEMRPFIGLGVVKNDTSPAWMPALILFILLVIAVCLIILTLRWTVSGSLPSVAFIFNILLLFAQLRWTR